MYKPSDHGALMLPEIWSIFETINFHDQAKSKVGDPEWRHPRKKPYPLDLLRHDQASHALVQHSTRRGNFHEYLVDRRGRLQPSSGHF